MPSYDEDVYLENALFPWLDDDSMECKETYEPPDPPTCICGSGEYAEAEYDARGIYIGRMCDHCSTERLSHFRPEVLTDPDYECDEPIDPED